MDVHLLKTGFLSFVALSILAPMPGFVAAAVPNPSYSTCIFPQTLPEAPASVTVEVTVQKGEARPIEGSIVQVDIVVESGSLNPGQTTAASVLSDSAGHAVVVFSEGISGTGEIRLQVHADGILLCASGLYPLVSPVSALPSTWGHLKAKYVSE